MSLIISKKQYNNLPNELKKNFSEFKNSHPTVKNLQLMEYLIKMVSRDNAIILDPFMGSGTTALACKQLGRNYIGFELNAEYVEIANARLKTYAKQTKLDIG